MDKLNNDNLSQFNIGLHTDSSPQNQPKGTQRFALNTVNETDKGDEFIRSNEGSNEQCVSFPDGYIPTGKVYIGNNETIVFLVSDDEVISEIGLLNDSCDYFTLVNDEESDEDDKLNFSLKNQIQGTYRLRRGCERTIYFVENGNKPRYYNIDKPEDFVNSDNTWSARKFSLFKEYNSIPKFTNVEVLDSGGLLEPGSYNIAVQYLDEGLNPSEWMVTSPIINIYNSLSNEEFLNINGSINSDEDYLAFPTTNKSIKVELDNLDGNYPFYRLAFIEATSGSGLVSSVKYTDTIPISKNFFIYTGENAAQSGTKEEIAFFNDVIERASHIEQIENRLILANTEGKKVNYCNLQKYASRIKADVVTKKVITNQIEDPNNTKNPTVHFGDMSEGGTGYMPGEIYSFGVIYVFDDGTLTPTFHIPGKNPDLDPTAVFAPGANVYPMSTNNESANNRYIDNDTCSSNNYWGLDSEGVALQNKAVRHHRFPYRSDIGVPLVKEEVSEGEQSFQYFNVQFGAVGEICLPAGVEAGTCTSSAVFQARVTYTVNGDEKELVLNINPANLSNPVNLNLNSELYTTDNITIIKIEEGDELGNVTDVTDGSMSPKGLQYTADVTDSIITTEGRIYSTEILGIKFSGIDIPTLDDTNGQQIIGYYIVRNERVENEKTILDTAVLLPVMSNDKYLSSGLLSPQLNNPDRVQKDLFGFLHPEHKFNGKEYTNFDSLKQEGNFNIIKRSFGKTIYNDVYDGTSYDSDIHKGGNDDGTGEADGFALTVLLRDTYLMFVIKALFNLVASNIKQVFYLKALESRDINDGANTAYNIAGDNKIGMIQLEEDTLINPIASEGKTALPYVSVGRTILDSYSNFRTLPYYKESLNMEEFDEDGKGTCTIFNGDVYTCPMRYTNTVFWDNRVARRGGKTSVWNYIIGGILIVVGVVLAFFTAGASTIVVGAGIAIIGGGALFISSGIERDNMVKAYSEEYARGLRETVLDDYVRAMYQYPNNSPTAYPGNGEYDFFLNGNSPVFYTNGYGGWGNDGPSDDEIQWIGDTLTDLWFESTVNISLRHKMTSDVPTFLDAPGVIESGNTSPITTREFYGLHWQVTNSRYPISKQEYHLNKKLLVYNSDRRDNREYVGLPFGEWYEVNPDYHRKNKEKIYYHLPLEYDCCTDCAEDFPHRWHWSEQSFQEELTDNYRVFLPNNYKDLEGETGEITGVFKIGNNLFMHTEEALFQIPRSYQERVTDQIVSFIGTGSYGDVPAQKVLDDDTGSSAGSQHKWGSIKTPSGYFFVSENQRKIYQFDGSKLKPISSIGMSNWFKENTELLVDRQYYDTTNRKFPYRDNPSNFLGSGFLMTYDTKKERIITTKKDYSLNPQLTQTPDYQLCVNNGVVTLFPNISETIDNQSALGWNYLGIENCRLKFQREVTKTRTEIRQVTKSLPNTAHVYVYYDTSGSFNTAGYLASLKVAVEAWYQALRPDDIGMTRLHQISNASERWVQWGTLAASDSAHTGDILVISLCNESSPSNNAYHDNNILNPVTNQPSTTYITDYNQFVDTVYPTLNSFIGINYPIATVGAPYNNSKAFIQQSLLAIKGDSYTNDEANDIDVNSVFTGPEWDSVKQTLVAANPYNVLGQGLDQYGWVAKVDRNDTDFGTTGYIIAPEDFANDINTLLANVTIVEDVEVQVTYVENEYKYVDGIVQPNPIAMDNSWTISYSLKQDKWISWHSYMPNFYLNVPEKFYSWINGNNYLWKHNSPINHQSFYGQIHPFILEYVSLSTPLSTRIWDYIMFLVDVKKYNPQFNDFVDVNNRFFDKLIAYNSRQCSGKMFIKVKDNDLTENYLLEQITNIDVNGIIVDRNERDWSINELRDIRTNYNEPIFITDLNSLQTEYFIDKVLNENSLNYQKEWTELESFRDKYLVIRLIFDNFGVDSDTPNGAIKMLMNFSAENETISTR